MLSRVAGRVRTPASRAVAPISSNWCPLHRNLFDQSFDRGVLHAVERTSADLGRRRARAARAKGLVPAAVVGAVGGVDAPTVPCWVRSADLIRERQRRGATFENTLYDVHLGGGRVESALPFDVALHPLTSEPLSVNFRRYNPGETPGARIGIPVRAINVDRCEPLVKDSGWILDICFRVPVYANGETIPDVLLMDLRGRQVGEIISASELHLPKGLRLRHPLTDFPVAKIVGRKKKK